MVKMGCLLLRGRAAPGAVRKGQDMVVEAYGSMGCSDTGVTGGCNARREWDEVDYEGAASPMPPMGAGAERR